jgi:hypothetical protein
MAITRINQQTYPNKLVPIERDSFSISRNWYSENEQELYTSLYRSLPSDKKPYVYTFINDTAKIDAKRADTQASPEGAIQEDLVRMSKSTNNTSRGLSFIQNQAILQQRAIFSETKNYYTGGVKDATEKKYPVRHIVSDEAGPIFGTATGDLPNRVQRTGTSGKYGVLRWYSATVGRDNFDSIWKASYIRTPIFSTTPSSAADWKYRPEYKNSNTDNVYSVMMSDSNALLSYKGKIPLYGTNGSTVGSFYNGDNIDSATPENQPNTAKQTIAPRDITRSFPQEFEGNLDNGYASVQKMNDRNNAAKDQQSGLMAVYHSMFSVLSAEDSKHPMYKKSAERYTSTAFSQVDEMANYDDIPDENDSTNLTFEQKMRNEAIVLDKRGFGKINSDNKFVYSDEYNMTGIISGDRDVIPRELLNENDPEQSKDIIFFYFYDLINKKYLPFRATLGSIQDQNSPEWEDIKYMGRADKLFVYKGFTRDVNFSFKVYAQSVEELIPIWEKINYLTGLTRPSKYTERAVITNEETLANQEIVASENFTDEVLAQIDTGETTGDESEFIYPPMITFRIGDLYVDQPAVLNSVTVTIPDEASWEIIRGDEYSYIYGTPETKVISKDVKTRQLPNMVEIAISLRMLEKEKSLTSNYRFGPKGGW